LQKTNLCAAIDATACPAADNHMKTEKADVIFHHRGWENTEKILKINNHYDLCGLGDLCG
jgi:hypothetical protein